MEYTTIVKPDGTIEVVPVEQTNNLPFNVGGQLFNQFNNAGAVPNVATEPYISPTYLMKQQLGMVPTGIMTQAPLKNLGFDTSFGVANEEDVEQEFLPDQKSGIAKLFEFLQKFSPTSAIVKGLGSILDFSDSPNYRPATVGVFGYTPEELNKMNALGGFYSEPMREMRRRSNRISNIMRRAAAGKNYSEKNLKNLMNQFGMDNVDTGAMIKSIKESSDMGYGKGGGGIFDSGRDYSSSPGAIAGDMEYGEE